MARRRVVCRDLPTETGGTELIEETRDAVPRRERRRFY
jgi:hypothetical protein